MLDLFLQIRPCVRWTFLSRCALSGAIVVRISINSVLGKSLCKYWLCVQNTLEHRSLPGSTRWVSDRFSQLPVCTRTGRYSESSALSPIFSFSAGVWCSMILYPSGQFLQWFVCPPDLPIKGKMGVGLESECHWFLFWFILPSGIESPLAQIILGCLMNKSMMVQQVTHFLLTFEIFLSPNRSELSWEICRHSVFFPLWSTWQSIQPNLQKDLPISFQSDLGFQGPENFTKVIYKFQWSPGCWDSHSLCVPCVQES